MFYATTTVSDGTRDHDELHAFARRAERDEWAAAEPPEPGYGEMWESRARAAIGSREAERGCAEGAYDGISVHGVGRLAPRWLEDATDGDSTMSAQPRDPSLPGVETWWTNVPASCL